MRMAITSDTHFGDPTCALVNGDIQNGYRLSPNYEAFKQTIGATVDYLILLGDVFDFSVSSYAEAYEAAQVFFEQIASDGLTRQIIYVPGNHDYQFWNMVEHEVNVTRRIKKGERIREFRWSVPGVFDFRKGCNNPGFNLPDVGLRTDGDVAYGGLFLDHLAKGKITFNVAYPNLYIVTDEETVLLTHGQYLEAYWAAAGELAPKIAGKDLGLEGDKPNLWELVALNVPLNELACTGVGQAGPLTSLVRRIQRDVKDSRYDDLDRYLDNLDDKIIDDHFKFRALDPREWATDTVINKVIKLIKNELRTVEKTRFAAEFMNKPPVRERFLNYLQASQKELGGLDRDSGYNEPTKCPPVRNVIFAHTHVPIHWDDNSLSIKVDGENTVVLHNTGGWLYDDTNTGSFVGAEIFFCEDGKMSSSSIR